MKANLKQGMGVAFVVTFCLILIPPVVAPRLEVWAVAPALLQKEPQLMKLCGEVFQTELSRWFYTNKFSGEYGFARFDGRAYGIACSQRFAVELERRNDGWRVASLFIK